MFSQCSSIFKFPTSFSGIELPELLFRRKEQWRVMPSTTHSTENTAALEMSKQRIATASFIMQTAEHKATRKTLERHGSVWSNSSVNPATEIDMETLQAPLHKVQDLSLISRYMLSKGFQKKKWHKLPPSESTLTCRPRVLRRGLAVWDTQRAY